ncbi:MAG: hypothetical protein K6F00_10740 [Lachnospiraceae bacterium]|nr:hypothetical protein [Lachnospiraceae bacterium]
MSGLLNYIRSQKTRIIMSFAGVFMGAVSVGIFKIASFGVDPFQTLMAGLDAMIPIEFGTLYVIVNVVLLTFSLIADRRNIGIATFINLFLLGYITQFAYSIFRKMLPNPSVPVRVVCMIVGIVVICFGASLYMTANLGVSTYDAISIVMAYKWHWGKFKFIRIGTDLVCVISGCIIFVLAGNPIEKIPTIAGVGTIITAFFMGPLIDFFNEKFSKPLLEKKNDLQKS